MGWGDLADPAPPRLDRDAPANCAVQNCPCVKMKTLKVMSMEFVKDHGVLHDYDKDFKPSGKFYRKPEWTGTGTTPKPVSYSMGDYIEVWLTFNVEPANACPETGTLKGVGPQGIFFELKNYTFVPGVNKVFLIAKKALPAVVQILDFYVTWKAVGVSANFDFFFDFTENKVYVTYAEPYNGTSWNNTVTIKRLHWLCTLCNGDTNGHDSVKKIHEKGGKYAVGAPIPKSHWEVAGGTKCECVDLSIFYMLAARMLGLKTADLVFLFPTPGKLTKESTDSYARESRHMIGREHEDRHGKHEDEEKLVLVDFSDDWNQYEACMKFTHPDRSGKMKTRYYAGGADAHDTAEQVMKSVCKLTYWTYRSGRGGSEDVCRDPGPAPVDVWG